MSPRCARRAFGTRLKGRMSPQTMTTATSITDRYLYTRDDPYRATTTIAVLDRPLPESSESISRRDASRGDNRLLRAPLSIDEQFPRRGTEKEDFVVGQKDGNTKRVSKRQRVRVESGLADRCKGNGVALRMSRWCGDSKIARRERTAGALMRFNCDPPRRNSFFSTGSTTQQHTRTGKGKANVWPQCCIRARDSQQHGR